MYLISDVKQQINIIYISEQYHVYLAKYSLINLKGSKSKVTKMEFRLKLALQRYEANKIPFVMLHNEKLHLK